MVACNRCGVVLELANVVGSPGKKCPVCGDPLDALAVACAHYEADNPSDLNDVARCALQTAAVARAEAAATRDAAITGAIEELL